MNDTVRTVVKVLVALVALWLVWQVALFVIKGILALIVPVLVVGGVYLLLTRTGAGRALIGGRRSLP